jgi:hypothetical protein
MNTHILKNENKMSTSLYPRFKNTKTLQKKPFLNGSAHANSLYAIFKNMGDVSLAHVSKYKTFKHAIRSTN